MTPSESNGRRGTRRRVWVLWLVAAVAYAVDLGSKLAVVAGLEGRDPVPVLGSWLELRVQRNPGAAFGMGSATTIVFTLIALAVAAVIVRVSRRLTSAPWAIALGLLLGGAVGNLTDRLFRSPGGMRGAVVDFISVRDFSVMNLADWAITCGGVLIVVLSFAGHELGDARLPREQAG
ncbi:MULTISPECIES: signal peptidase II [unclassified Streptomyces]|uniref:signal peptidase II n=1 Tax=unclassified Streptomyces TaxID=2593676 RepID=UPI001369BC96|nr:signal peptidase II [Streptomyces sp. SID6139]MYR24593.1 signal peptidase II [Streptomyces sp. SID6137]